MAEHPTAEAITSLEAAVNAGLQYFRGKREAARRMPDPAAKVFVGRSGAGASAIDRLQMIASHRNGYVDEMRGQT